MGVRVPVGHARAGRSGPRHPRRGYPVLWLRLATLTIMLRSSQATSTQFDVAAYRDLVDTVAAELAAAEPIDDDVVLDVVGSAIVSPAARGLIAAADVDPLQLTARAAAVARRFAPRQAATARTAGDEIVILLRQQIDLAWWNGVADFDTSADVAGDASLVDMRALRRARKVRFGFTLASDRLLPRARNYAVRHWFRDIAPGTPDRRGLTRAADGQPAQPAGRRFRRTSRSRTAADVGQLSDPQRRGSTAPAGTRFLGASAQRPLPRMGRRHRGVVVRPVRRRRRPGGGAGALPRPWTHQCHRRGQHLAYLPQPRAPARWDV